MSDGTLFFVKSARYGNPGNEVARILFFYPWAYSIFQDT